MRLQLIILFLFTATLPASFAQPLSQPKLDSLTELYTHNSFPILRELLRMPGDANHPDDIEVNVKWAEKAFAARGFKTQRLETPYVPLLLASQTFKPGAPTVLVYLQMDGQPVDSSRWFQANPHEPVLKKPADMGMWSEIPWDQLENYDEDWRIFARCASDAKGPVAMFLGALDALKAINRQPDFNIKVIMDFEEELGSPHLPQAVSVFSDALKADMMVIFDGPRHLSNQPTLTFGARGIATLTLTTYGPVSAQHSGHYGNYVPNPALRLAQLLATMKDAEGRVTIPGFYDGIKIDRATASILAAVPDDEEAMRERLQIASVDQVGTSYQESIQYPSLNIRGMQSGWIDREVRTIIPAWARAELDVRLVLESDPDRLIGLIRQHIEDQGYVVSSDFPSAEMRLAHPKIASLKSKVAYQSFRTDLNSRCGKWLYRALKGAFGQEPIRIRMTGGSIPISPFVRTLDIPAVSVPTVNRDNNQHAPNENIRLGNFRDGIKTMISILLEPIR